MRALFQGLRGTQPAPVKPYADTLFKPATYEYFVDLDERGEFFADVRNTAGKTVFEIHGSEIFEDGFMRDKHDMDGLKEHLVSLGIMKSSQHLVIAVH